MPKPLWTINRLDPRRRDYCSRHGVINAVRGPRDKTRSDYMKHWCCPYCGRVLDKYVEAKDGGKKEPIKCPV